TLRILLGNLHDFGADSPGAAVDDRRRASLSEEPSATITDRWILDRLQQVIEECRAAYGAYEFHKVYHTLNQFCAVDLSSLYIDITKDRMYCDAPNSPRRRATQSAMLQIFEALCQLLAPILVFTAEEAWGYRDDGRGSVHLQLFPEVQGNLRDLVVREQVEELLKLRGVIGQAVEKARQKKLIGNALEAAVVLRCDERFAAAIPREELDEFFILSDLTLEAGEEPVASIRQTPNKKCARCWRHRATVGTIAAHPELCDRCASVVEARA
ncbi:MAG TPA: class I tRNA ligase family protein, partial [Chthoniobacterales bacterium]|nr:class I tRNA ligase family protein [Chthoniobacterales bacterium]